MPPDTPPVDPPRVADRALSSGEMPVDVVERHRIQLAKDLRVVPEAVKISIDLVYTDKDGLLRSAFIG